MWDAITGLIVALIIVFVVLRGERIVKAYLENKRHETDLADERKRAELGLREREAELRQLEAGRQSELDSMTIEERAELERAELRRRAAEADAAAKVAAATTVARVAEEEQVIAARAEGRAIAAKEEAISAPLARTSSDLEPLLEAYGAYVDRTEDAITFSDWLGSIALVDGRART